MVVHEGGKASGFKNSSEGDTYDDDGVSLFHIKGTDETNVVGVQTAEAASSLNSMDCFVLVTPTHVYSWHGKGAMEAEVASADKIAKILQSHSNGPPGTAAPAREFVGVAEGEEPEEFWNGVGGKGEYAEAPEGEPLPAEPRLFHLTNKFGAFQVEEIPDFTQEDMLDDDVMMVDVGTAVYLWVGSGANREEKDKSVETAQKFIEAAAQSDGRDADCPIVQVSAGNEPVLFTQFFPGWDPGFAEKNKFVDPCKWFSSPPSSPFLSFSFARLFLFFG